MHRPVTLVILALVLSTAGVLGAADTRELELVSQVFGNTRTLRVLLPPGYAR